MSPGQHQVYADLVGGLVDAREDPAVARFDAELAAAVTRGEVSPETAKRLRAWQRASVRGVADHVRAVLPTVLAAVESAQADARAHVADLAAAFADAATTTPATTVDAATAADPGTTADPDVVGRPWPPGPRVSSEVAPPPAIPTQASVVRASAVGDTPGPTSSLPSRRPSSLGAATSRQMVADLVPSRPPVVHEPR